MAHGLAAPSDAADGCDARLSGRRWFLVLLSHVGDEAAAGKLPADPDAARLESRQPGTTFAISRRGSP